MKLNNKGVTIIELILSFAILIVIVYGMFNVVVEIRSYSEDKQMEQELAEFKNRMIYLIQDDLVKLGFKSYTSNGCPTDNYIKCKEINFKDGTSKKLIINMKEKTITYDGTKYEIPYGNLIEFVDENVMGLCSNASYKNSSDCTTNDGVWNSNYDSYHNVTFTRNTISGITTIDIPYFIVGENTNYGFKIIHSYNLDE